MDFRQWQRFESGNGICSAAGNCPVSGGQSRGVCRCICSTRCTKAGIHTTSQNCERSVYRCDAIRCRRLQNNCRSTYPNALRISSQSYGDRACIADIPSGAASSGNINTNTGTCSSVQSDPAVYRVSANATPPKTSNIGSKLVSTSSIVTRQGCQCRSVVGILRQGLILNNCHTC